MINPNPQKNSFRQHSSLMNVLLVSLLALGLTACKTQQTAVVPTEPVTTAKAKPIQMILDSDFGSSTDDLFALMMLNHYIDEGRVDLKGIVVDREGEKNAGVVDIFNTYYGHPNIPVGLERNGVKNPRSFIPYNGICDLKDKAGQPLFKRSLDTSKLPDGWKLYRQLLSKAEDKSIVIVAIGFVTTLAQLMESGADEYSQMSGVDLLDQKVKAIYIQSGRFSAGDSLCGYNMRAASKHSEIFYSKLPKSVDLIMSPSNIGDGMDYLPQDVLVDLSATEVNPIKSVYTNYTCDTGQRMWDTNCLVNAVEGDGQYHLSPRGWVTFVEKGEQSLMLFQEDPNGNARYQLPGDSYFNMEKLMDIRQYNRINPHPATYTIESPQPIRLGKEATAWAKPRLRQLMDKYLGSAGNKLDPDEFRNVFIPVGYYGTNILEYREAEKMIVDTLYTEMLDKAIRLGKKSLLIITGVPASGKSTAARQLDLTKEGLVYDAAISGKNRLDGVINRAKQKGIEKITMMMVYNDPLTCMKNAVNRGKTSYRFIGVGYMVQSFRENIGKLAQVRKNHPDVVIIPVDRTGNQTFKNVSFEDALKWNYDISDADIESMFKYLLEEIDGGELDPGQLKLITGDIDSIQNLSEGNKALAKQITEKVDEILKNYEAR